MFLLPSCKKCKNYLDGARCEAFSRIPDEIMTGEHDHTEPYEGDGGIRFEPIED